MKKNKRSVIVYLAGKYSGDVGENIATARKYAIKIWEAGYTCICPHLNTAHFEKDCKCTQDDYIEGDIEMLRQCADILFLMPGWEDSIGSVIEKSRARSCYLPIVYSMKGLDEIYKEEYDGS